MELSLDAAHLQAIPARLVVACAAWFLATQPNWMAMRTLVSAVIQAVQRRIAHKQKHASDLAHQLVEIV